MHYEETFSIATRYDELHEKACELFGVCNVSTTLGSYSDDRAPGTGGYLKFQSSVVFFWFSIFCTFDDHCRMYIAYVARITRNIIVSTVFI